MWLLVYPSSGGNILKGQKFHLQLEVGQFSSTGQTCEHRFYKIVLPSESTVVKKETFHLKTGKIIFYRRCGTHLFWTIVLYIGTIKLWPHIKGKKFWPCFGVESSFFFTTVNIDLNILFWKYYYIHVSVVKDRGNIKWIHICNGYIYGYIHICNKNVS